MSALTATLAVLHLGLLRPPQLAPALAPQHAVRLAPPRMSPASILEEAAEASTLKLPDTPVAEECPIEGEQRSALILGWFFASERELAHVQRLYRRNGFTDVVVEPSHVGIITKPRGWYRAMRRRLNPRVQEAHKAGVRTLPREELGRHFDVVHCLSGGFLALYVLLRSGVGLKFNRILFDSTPILPKPAAFTRFARAYLASVGLGALLWLLPAALHKWMVQARWACSLAYIKAKHGVLQLLGRTQGEELSRWADGPVSWALDGYWDRVERHALGTIYEGAAQCAGSECIFLYNPDDPFIDSKDVRYAAQLARDAGLNVREAVVEVDHVKALFAMPRTVFDLLRPADTDAAPPTQPPPAKHQMLRQLVLDGTAADAAVPGGAEAAHGGAEAVHGGAEAATHAAHAAAADALAHPAPLTPAGLHSPSASPRPERAGVVV